MRLVFVVTPSLVITGLVANWQQPTGQPTANRHGARSLQIISLRIRPPPRVCTPARPPCTNIKWKGSYERGHRINYTRTQILRSCMQYTTVLQHDAGNGAKTPRLTGDVMIQNPKQAGKPACILSSLASFSAMPELPILNGGSCCSVAKMQERA